MRQVIYFKDCSSITEVNSNLVRLFESNYKEPSKRDSIYGKILEEHMYLVCTTENIKDLCRSSQFPQEYSNPKPIQYNMGRWINSTYNAVNSKGGKVGSIYFMYLKEIEALDLKPKKEDLELIARLCGYNSGWVFYRCKDLKI